MVNPLHSSLTPIRHNEGYAEWAVSPSVVDDAPVLASAWKMWNDELDVMLRNGGVDPATVTRTETLHPGPLGTIARIDWTDAPTS